MPLISRRVMEAIAVNHDFFEEPMNNADFPAFIEELKYKPMKLVDRLRKHIKEAVEKTSASLNEPVLVIDEYSAANELLDGLRNIFHQELSALPDQKEEPQYVG
jgi:hypothetical protein